MHRTDSGNSLEIAEESVADALPAGTPLTTGCQNAQGVTTCGEAPRFSTVSAEEDPHRTADRNEILNKRDIDVASAECFH